MKSLLVALNILLVLVILGLVLFWQPVADELPIPGTQAARMAAEAPPALPSEQPVTKIRPNPPTN
jgi:hypothetical protein